MNSQGPGPGPGPTAAKANYIILPRYYLHFVAPAWRQACVVLALAVGRLVFALVLDLAVALTLPAFSRASLFGQTSHGRLPQRLDLRRSTSALGHLGGF